MPHASVSHLWGWAGPCCPDGPPPCKMGAFSLPQGTFLLATAGHHLLSRRGQGRGAFSNTGCAHSHLWDLEPLRGFVFKSGSTFV